MRRLTLPILCPRRVPAGEIIELEESRGPAIFAVGRDAYFMAFITRGPGFDDVHWIVGVGRDRALQAFFWGDAAARSRPRVQEQVRRNGETVTILRFPRYPRGGQNGGHVGGVVKRDGLTLFASVHDPRYGRLAVNIARSIRAPE